MAGNRIISINISDYFNDKVEEARREQVRQKQLKEAYVQTRIVLFEKTAKPKITINAIDLFSQYLAFENMFAETLMKSLNNINGI